MKGWSLTAAQCRALEQELPQTRETGLMRRLLALLQVNQGWSIAEVAQGLRVDRRRVYRWIQQDAACPQPQVLKDQRGQGRPPIWNIDLTQCLQTALTQSPRQLGYPANTWTVALLRNFLEACYPTCQVSARTVRRWLKHLGYGWKRFRYILAPHPEAEKKSRIFQQIQALSPRTALLAEDETDLLLFPPLRAGWAPCGQSATVLLSGYNARRIILGTLNLRTGRMLNLEQTHKRSDNFQENLDFLHKHYRTVPVALLLD